MKPAGALALQQVTDAGLGLDLWAPSPSETKLGSIDFVRGLALIAAAEKRELTGESTTAFWLALSEFEAVDFAAGVRATLKLERFISPAVAFEHCATARQERLRLEAERIEREERSRAQAAADLAAQDLARRREALAAARPLWGPPSSARELLDRMVAITGCSRTTLWISLHSSTLAPAPWNAEHGTLVLQPHIEFAALLRAHEAELQALARDAAAGLDVVVQLVADAADPKVAA